MDGMLNVITKCSIAGTHIVDHTMIDIGHLKVSCINQYGIITQVYFIIV